MVTYRTSGPWGAGKGSNLTPAEVDTNFHELQGLINDALTGLSEPVGIDDITYDNGTLTFELSDSTTRGPFDLPLAVFRWRGRWTATTSYAEFDILYHPSLGGYMVLRDHTSGSTFNPSLVISGQPVYRLLWRMIPGGLWPIQNVAAQNYTLLLTDAQHFLRMTNAAETVVTIPPNSTAAFPIATEIMLRAANSPTVHITGGLGVLVNLPLGTTGLSEFGGVAYLKKVDTNEWDVWYGGESGSMPSEPSFPTVESETSESETSESEGTPEGNLQVESDGGGEFGISGYSRGWEDALMVPDLGEVINPLGDYTVNLYVNFGSFIGYLGIETENTDAVTEVDFPLYLNVKIGDSYEETYGFALFEGTTALYTGLPPSFNHLNDGQWVTVEITEGEAPSEVSETETESETPPTEFACARLLDYDFGGNTWGFQYYDYTVRQRVRATWLTQPGTHIRLGFKSGSREGSTGEIPMTGTDIPTGFTETDDLWWNDGMKVTKVFIGRAGGDDFDFAEPPTEVLFGGQSGFEVPAYDPFGSEVVDEFEATALSDYVPFEITGEDDIVIALHFDTEQNKANFNRNHRISGNSRLAYLAGGDTADDTSWPGYTELTSSWSNLLEVVDVCVVGDTIDNPTATEGTEDNFYSVTSGVRTGKGTAGATSGMGTFGVVHNPVDSYTVLALTDGDTIADYGVLVIAGETGPASLTVSGPGLTSRTFNFLLTSGGNRIYHNNTGYLGLLHNKWYQISLS